MGTQDRVFCIPSKGLDYQKGGFEMFGRWKKPIIIFILFSLWTSLTNIVSADEDRIAQYISINGVKVESLRSQQVEGSVRLVGNTNKEKIKILVTKDKTQTWYEVKLDNGKFDEEVWLSLGKGNYTVAIMVNETERKYSYGPKFIIHNTQEVDKYSVPGKDIESNDEDIIKLAEQIVGGLNSDLEKAQAIHNWVSKNINYDYEKYIKHQNNNYDNQYGALTTLESKKGVCYDYAALVAALGRAVGLQTKMIKGEGITESFRGYHAWNEIYISEENRWLKLDATFSSTSGQYYFDSAKFDESHIKADEC